jgi:hypothetical protein
MLHNHHRAGLLSKPYKCESYIELWATQDVTISELPYGFETQGAISLKGFAVRPFKQPSPAPCSNFLQLAGKLEAPQLRMEEKDGTIGIDIV